jgi:hypothetical protein
MFPGVGFQQFADQAANLIRRLSSDITRLKRPSFRGRESSSKGEGGISDRVAIRQDGSQCILSLANGAEEE